MSSTPRMRAVYFVPLATLLYLLIVSVALNTGPVPIDSLSLLLMSMRGEALDATAQLDWHILRDIRLPRVLLASLVGAALAMAGAAMQALLRNPLAEPGIVGVSSGAALAAVLVLYFGLVSWHSALLPLSAVLGSCVALLLVLSLAGRSPAVTTLILAGVAVSAMLGGGIALALNFAPNPFALQEISFWLMGSVAHRDLAQVGMVLPFMLTGALLLVISGRFLRALTLGETTAASMGYHLTKQRALVLLGVALLTGAAVAVAGVVGFVGLMVPHMVRFIGGEDPRRVLWWSAWLGAAMLLLVDVLVQVVSPATELKLGVLMSLIGGPFFLLLLTTQRRWRSL
ncbi:FecCD family ABC transporter permease [Aliidiomarina sedimenti]|nr:iron ABC transporter permease [Aliidiomarina sedimenti]